MISSRKGKLAEIKARQYLCNLGWKIVALNYRCRFGEIDIIAFDSGGIKKNKSLDVSLNSDVSKELVFVEVRYRRTSLVIDPIETITNIKQARLIGTAKAFLSSNPQYRYLEFRFDVLAYTESFQLRHWRAAFLW